MQLFPPGAQGRRLWAHTLSGTRRLLLLHSALGLLTALGSVHWSQLPTSASVNPVCRGSAWAEGGGSFVRSVSPLQPRNTVVSLAMFSLQGGGPSHPPDSLPGLPIATLPELLPNLPVAMESGMTVTMSHLSLHPHV